VPGLVRGGSQHFTLPLASKNPWRMWRNAAALARLIRQQDISLVHARSRAPAWSAYWACRRTGVPLVTTFHGSYNHQNRLKRRYNAVMTFGQRVIAISGYIRDHIQQIYGTNPAKIQVIQRGSIWINSIPPRWRRGGWCSWLRIGGCPMGARHHAAWPIDTLEGAAVAVRGDGATESTRPVLASWWAGMRGAPPIAKEVMDRIEQLGLSAQVKLVGRCQDMPAAYRLADVVVVPSLDPEAFGRTMAEGMAMGCMVVASDHGAAPEVLGHGQYGWLFPLAMQRLWRLL
jgi:glycosyltransferase involved in cell wall biosynthesis